MTNFFISLLQHKETRTPTYKIIFRNKPYYREDNKPWITALKLLIVISASYFSVKWILDYIHRRKKRKNLIVKKPYESQFNTAYRSSSYSYYQSPSQEVLFNTEEWRWIERSRENRGFAFTVEPYKSQINTAYNTSSYSYYQSPSQAVQLNTKGKSDKWIEKSRKNKDFSFKVKGPSLTQKIVPKKILFEGLVEATTTEKNEWTAMIKKTMGSAPISIKKIQKIQNSFLEAMYLLKKEEYKLRYSVVHEKVLIHVTGAENVESIIRDNFDWRKVTRGLFGFGTSFSGDADYANTYANKHIGGERVFIVTKILISKCFNGSSKNVVVPPGNYDTAVGNKSKVYVKFCDHEFLPMFVIYFSDTSKQLNNYSKQYCNPDCGDY